MMSTDRRPHHLIYRPFFLIAELFISECLCDIDSYECIRFFILICCFLQLVPAVTELVVSELLYMQYTDPRKACYLYINSTGCTRADGEVVGFETEATAIYDTMKYIGNEVIYLSLLTFPPPYFFFLGLHSWNWCCYRSGLRSFICWTEREAFHDAACYCDASSTKSSFNWPKTDNWTPNKMERSFRAEKVHAQDSSRNYRAIGIENWPGNLPVFFLSVYPNLIMYL